ncbi:MAG: hypothetical protein JNM70_05240, partial [Anaerolineae bacterium]|nr:hypothetical protein [Anaerolineae bacterium]
MDFLGIVIVALAGIFTILGSYFEWVWWWRLNGLGKFLYDRYGHKNIRLYEAVMGFVLIAFAARELLISILATGWGKALC